MMDKDEFRRKAKELGYNDEEISDSIAEHEKAAAKGINLPLEFSLIEKPIY